jgi:uncharacterized membrane protein YuzA (DUF378 family)
MSKSTISIMVKIMIIALAITGGICCYLMFDIVGYLFPGFSYKSHLIWTIFVEIAAIPCFLSLIPAWLISNNIRDNYAFCYSNVKLMKIIGIFMGIDSLIILLCNIIFYAIGISFYFMFIGFFLIFAIFFALSVCAFALSSLIGNATQLQVENDLTI